uniref:Uncharacterized protein n=1 Tax=Aegilops tauschii subsp. strangulata TaxID=200361 RepID=A0A453EVN4_AEGTS
MEEAPMAAAASMYWISSARDSRRAPSSSARACRSSFSAWTTAHRRAASCAAAATAQFRARSAAASASSSSTCSSLRARDRCADSRFDSLRLRFLSSVSAAGGARVASEPADDDVTVNSLV